MRFSFLKQGVHLASYYKAIILFIMTCILGDYNFLYCLILSKVDTVADKPFVEGGRYDTYFH